MYAGNGDNLRGFTDLRNCCGRRSGSIGVTDALGFPLYRIYTITSYLNSLHSLYPPMYIYDARDITNNTYYMLLYILSIVGKFMYTYKTILLQEFETLVHFHAIYKF